LPPANAREAVNEFKEDLRQLLRLVAGHVQIRRRILDGGKVIILEPPNNLGVRLRDDLFLWYSYELTLRPGEAGEAYSTTDYQIVLQRVQPKTWFDDASEEWLVRWEYHPAGSSLKSPHLHVNGATPAGWAIPAGPLKELHLPTGRPPMEDAIEFIIVAFNGCRAMLAEDCKAVIDGQPACRCVAQLAAARRRFAERRHWLIPPGFSNEALPR
jgi:hypothetical protein